RRGSGGKNGPEPGRSAGVGLYRRRNACRCGIQLPQLERGSGGQIDRIGKVGGRKQSFLRRSVFGSARPPSTLGDNAWAVFRRARGSLEAQSARGRPAVSEGFGVFARLWRRPQGVWARRALFQIHLWAGI